MVKKVDLSGADAMGMPRQACLGALGVLHYIIVLGVRGQKFSIII